jgi:hypothetical protein
MGLIDARMARRLRVSTLATGFKASAGTLDNPLQCLFWALNSAVECHLHTVEVAGSNPAAPTISVIPTMRVPRSLVRR